MRKLAFPLRVIRYLAASLTDLANEFLIEIGEQIEDLGWLAAGAEIGYIEQTNERFDERETQFVRRLMASPEATSWPKSFHALARDICLTYKCAPVRQAPCYLFADRQRCR